MTTCVTVLAHLGAGQAQVVLGGGTCAKGGFIRDKPSPSWRTSHPLPLSTIADAGRDA